MTGATDDDVGTLVLEAAERGVLDRRLLRVLGIDLDDPPEAVGLVLKPGLRVSKRGSTFSQPREVGASARPYRLSAGLVPAVRKYPLKFSSPESTVPQGVVPPAQLPRVPRAAVPVGSSLVFSRSEPAAGPLKEKGVDAVIRRFVDAPDDVGPLLALLAPLQFDDRHAVRGHRDAPLLVQLGGSRGGREHDVLVGVLLVRDEDRLTPVVRDEDVEVVVVVPELACLQRRGLRGGVEGVRGARSSGSPHRMIGAHR